MFKFILYALLAILVIQMIRTTKRIRSSQREGPEDEEKEKGKPPVLNIPDIQDAKFEDLTEPDDQEKEKPRDSPPPK